MPTDLCRWCGSTYDLVHGHICTPLITTTSTGGDHARDQVGVDPTEPAPEDAEPAHPVWGYPFPAAGPPDLQQAIQVATDALRAVPGMHLTKDEAARVAVEAAAPVLLQATRDRLADLEGTARAVLSCLHAGNVFTAESLLRHALDGPAAQEDGDQACDACGGLFTHDPQCGYLAEEHRDGTEGRQ